MNLMTRISVFAQKFRGEDQKKQFRGDDQRKVFGAKSQASFRRSLVCFVLERDFTHAWGGGGAQAVFWGEQAPKSIPVVAPDMILSFGAQSSFGWADLSFGKAQAVIWEGTAPKCPPVAPGLCATTRPQQSLPNSCFFTSNLQHIRLMIRSTD